MMTLHAIECSCTLYLCSEHLSHFIESFAAIGYTGTNPLCAPEPLESTEEPGLLYARSGRFTIASRQDEHGNNLWAPYVTVSAKVYTSCDNI